MPKDSKQPERQPKPMKPEPVKSKKQRSLNAQPARPISEKMPGQEQDPKRRLGNFTGTGEHARQGGRQAGIVGQNKQKLHND